MRLPNPQRDLRNELASRDRRDAGQDAKSWFGKEKSLP